MKFFIKYLLPKKDTEKNFRTQLFIFESHLKYLLKTSFWKIIDLKVHAYERKWNRYTVS